MIPLKLRGRWRARLGCGLLAMPLLFAGASTGQAQGSGAAAADGGSSTMLHLIQLMVKNGVLTREQAEPLLREAEQEARAAKPARPTRAATKPAPGEGQGGGPGGAPGGAQVATGATAGAAAAVPGSVRVTYVPELVRQQIAAEVKQEVMQEAQEQGWAEPNALPEWVQRVKVFGDLRVRGEEDTLSGNNYPFFPDFNTINGLSNGFDSNAGLPPPILNTIEDRTRFRLRARLGVDAQINDWINSEIRLGTGNDRSPITENQTLGVGGDFSKYAIWLDRAFIQLLPTPWLTVDLGREPNPFWTTSLLFYDELNFDGIAAQVRQPIATGVTGFMSAGAFPVFNTDFNFGSTNTVKTNSHDAYLAALQAGAEWKINDSYLAKAALGYFSFLNVQGSQSAPCLSPTGYGSCATDDERPGWTQFGNTLFPLRNITPIGTSTVTPNPQFYGLASRFNVLDLRADFNILNFHPVDIVLTGDFVKNLGFNSSAIVNHGPVNNLGANTSTWSGGDTGYLMQVTFGHLQLEKLWDWNLSLGYRYIESDAVLDALNDSDFHLGGNNAKGYTVAGALALDRNVWFGGHFYSATQVSGPPYTANVLLVDLNAKF